MGSAKKIAASLSFVIAAFIGTSACANDVKLGGSLRLNLSMSDWSENSKERNGDGSFNIFTLTANGTIDDIILSADYRFYGYMDVPHHGWFGYQFTPALQGQFGITKVPFGILPYESNNYWFGVPYYLGLNDDYDMGFKLLYKNAPFDIQVAFFKNSEQGSSDLNSYSIDPVTNGIDQLNEETNQINGRFAYKVTHGENSSSELGISIEYGQLYNSSTKDTGDHSAIALHLNGFYGPWNLQLEAITYQYDPENPVGVSDKTILMGAFGGSYLVASEATLVVANLSYSLPVEWGPAKNLLFYHDYSHMLKDESGFEDSIIRTLGVAISAGPIWTNIDFISAENAVWLNGKSNPFAEGSKDEGASTLFNINVGYYF